MPRYFVIRESSHFFGKGMMTLVIHWRGGESVVYTFEQTAWMASIIWSKSLTIQIITNTLPKRKELHTHYIKCLRVMYAVKLCTLENCRFKALRVRTVSKRHVRSSMFTATFKLVSRVIFGTMKDGSLVINTLASFKCLTWRSLFWNGANDMSEMVNMINGFLSKSSKLCVVRIMRFCSNFASL